MTVYYYQTYINTLATNNTAKVNDAINVYPNPATDMITISQSGVIQKGLVSVSLMNISGQVVSRQKMPSQNEMQISVGYLLPGIYYVVIQDAAGNTLHRQAVVKQ
jgi:long-subunit fatty acid transport protein